ncbi:MAG TPA: kelch repeat-containing protein [Kofleriaceae bacterium]|nr:kelch repeat-containing protein [Kofleriaceae bacterium]
MRLLVLLALVGCSDTEPDPPGPPWTQGPDLPDGERRLEASAVGQGGRVLVIGGFVTSDREVPPLEITRAIWQFDPRTDVWSRFPVEAPVAWTHANVASVGGSLYLLGGLEGAAFTPSGRAFRLRPGAMTWEELAPMPVGRERGASAVVVTTGHIS